MLRMARGSASRSQEVQLEAPSLVTPELNNLAELQMTQVMLETMDKWHAATDPLYKLMLKDGIDTLRRQLRLPPLPADGAPRATGTTSLAMGNETGGAFVEAWGCFFCWLSLIFVK